MRRSLTLLLLVAACGGDGGAAGSPTSMTPTSGGAATSAPTTSTEPPTTSTVPLATTTMAPLPPPDYESLAPLFEQEVGRYGYRVSRASLIDLATYEETPEGTHLAIYLEPGDDYTPGEVAALIPDLTRVFAPRVFDSWPGLESFDFCQEAHGFDGEGTPPSLTIINLTRESVSGVDWRVIDLAALIEIAAAHEGATVWATGDVRSSATWQAAAGA